MSNVIVCRSCNGQSFGYEHSWNGCLRCGHPFGNLMCNDFPFMKTVSPHGIPESEREAMRKEINAVAKDIGERNRQREYRNKIEAVWPEAAIGFILIAVFFVVMAVAVVVYS